MVEEIGYYAILDENNFVTRIITGKKGSGFPEGFDSWEAYYADILGERVMETCQKGTIRQKYAIVGGYYDSDFNAFVPPKPHPSWILSGEIEWVAPVSKPDEDNIYGWDEEQQQWLLIGPR